MLKHLCSTLNVDQLSSCEAALCRYETEWSRAKTETIWALDQRAFPLTTETHQCTRARPYTCAHWTQTRHKPRTHTSLKNRWNVCFTFRRAQLILATLCLHSKNPQYSCDSLRVYKGNQWNRVACHGTKSVHTLSVPIWNTLWFYCV